MLTKKQFDNLWKCFVRAIINLEEYRNCLLSEGLSLVDTDKIIGAINSGISDDVRNSIRATLPD
jgi:hypothetical protein